MDDTDRNDWSINSGIGGRLRPEWVVDVGRYMQLEPLARVNRNTIGRAANFELIKKTTAVKILIGVNKKLKEQRMPLYDIENTLKDNFKV